MGNRSWKNKDFATGEELTDYANEEDIDLKKDTIIVQDTLGKWHLFHEEN